MLLRPRPIAALLALTAMSACVGGDAPTTPSPDGGARAAKATGSSNPPATFFIANDVGLGLRGDGAFLEAGSSRYDNGKCGVSALVYASPGGSGDAIMNSAATRDRQCPRTVRIAYRRILADGGTEDRGGETTTTFLNVRQIHRIDSNGSPLFHIPLGDSEERTLAFDDAGLRCGASGTAAIVFAPDLKDGTVTGADRVVVTRTAANEWLVETKPDVIDADGNVVHHDKAWCRGDGKLYHMPLRLIIRTNTALSPS